jgi:hypothetical protein
MKNTHRQQTFSVILKFKLFFHGITELAKDRSISINMYIYETKTSGMDHDSPSHEQGKTTVRQRHTIYDYDNERCAARCVSTQN